MIEFRDTLTGLIDEYGAVEEDQFELPKPAVIGDKRTKQVKLADLVIYIKDTNHILLIF